MSNIKDKCNTCGCDFGTDGCSRQSLKDSRYCATFENGQIVQECCDQCAQEAESFVENMDLT